MQTRPDWVDNALFPFESHFVSLGAAEVHYVDEGSGPTLLMVHGNPTWSFDYREVIQTLSTQFRCVALDLPGFGLSSALEGYAYLPGDHARVVASFIETMDLRDYTIVVHDWGGPIGLTAALGSPERLSGVVIGNTWGWPVNGDRHFELFSGLMGGPIARVGSRLGNLLVRAMIPSGHNLRKPTHAEMNQYLSPANSPIRRRACSILPAQIIAGHDFLAALEPRLSRLADVPALLVWADKDDAFRIEELEHWQRILPAARTVIVQGAGHFLPSDAPVELAEAISGWYPERSKTSKGGRA